MMEKKLTATKEEATTKTQEWRNCLKLYVECEYMTRATIIVEKIGLDVLLSNDWLQTFEVNFCGLLNALVCNDTSLSLKQKNNFLKVCELFSTDKFSFDPMIEDNIRLDTISNIPLRNFAQSLDNIILIGEKKLSIITNSDRADNIQKLQAKTKQLKTYLKPWLKGKITYNEYYTSRIHKHPNDIQNSIFVPFFIFQ